MYDQLNVFGGSDRVESLQEIAKRRFENLDSSLPNIISYGGGRNSTAMIILLIKMGIKIDAILFADTGGEMPETYEFIDLFSDWTEINGQCRITTLRAEISAKSFTRKPYIAARQVWQTIAKTENTPAIALSIWWMGIISSPWATLEEHALITNSLPSKAYGRSSCSYQFKIEPQDKWVEANYPDGKINKFIGIHSEEQSRVINKKNGKAMWCDRKYEYQYPLVALDLNDRICHQIIQSAGLPVPPKSSCFFCPNRKISEIRELKQTHPELYERGLLIEQTAQYGVHWRDGSTTKGLGRRFAWKDIDEYSDIAIAGLDFNSRNCGCMD